MRQRVALYPRKIVSRLEPREPALHKLMNQRTQPLRLIEGAHSDRKIFSLASQRMSLVMILTVQSTPALPAKMTTPGRRSYISGRLATHQPERIARNRRSHENGSATATPTPIAVAIDNIENPIDFISNRPTKTPTHEWPVNHARDTKTIHPKD